jgi:molybdopterin synthase catalytic subunit
LSVRVQREDFDVGAEVRNLTAGRTDIGAIVTFTGVVREENDGRPLRAMTLEHYPGMTEKAIEEIVGQAKGRWSLYDALVIHRVGRLRPTDQIVLVVVTSAHRGDAFAACEFIMDYLKTRAPFWKKEQAGGGARWVEARATDDIAAERWRLKG